jgi:hypothetical protein
MAPQYGYGDEFESQASPAFQSYVDALRDYLDAPGAHSMHRARELGADALRAGWHVPDVLALHQDALTLCLGRVASAETRRKSILRASSFLEEALGPFEMVGDRFHGPLFATRPSSPSSTRAGGAGVAYRMDRDPEHGSWTPTAPR